MIYLDYCANTPTDPLVLSRYIEIEQRYIGNPNSKHSAGREANDVLSERLISSRRRLSILPVPVRPTIWRLRGQVYVFP